MSRSSLKEIGKRPFFMSTLKRKVLLLYDPPEDITGNFFFTIFPSLSFHRLFLPHFNFHQIHIFLNLHQGKRNSRLTIFFWWKILCFHHISCSCLLCMNINLDTIMTAAGHRNINFSHHLLLPFLTRMVIRNFFLHRIINCFYLLIYLIVLKNK